MRINRVTIVVLDSAGVGALPDADRYGDAGANTIGNISRVRKLHLPNMAKMGLGNIIEINGVPPAKRPTGAFGKMAEMSKGKDTTTGHWEIAGIILDKPFPTYPEGFPTEIINAFETKIGRKVLGNKVASGTEIIRELGPQHIKTGYPIVYTSADSVFQIAAHEEVIPIEELYHYCRLAREILVGEHAVGRVIARPFVGVEGNFQRTANRRDFSLEPPGPTLLDLLKEKGYRVAGVGKIEDIFNGRGLTEAVHTKDNTDGVDKTIDFLKQDFNGLIFTNLVEFDSSYGHRNDIEGYAQALEDFDRRVPEILEYISPGQLLVITADHGCDPAFPGTDHTREHVPILIYGPGVYTGTDLGTRRSFADLGATVADIFGLETENGQSFKEYLLKED